MKDSNTLIKTLLKWSFWLLLLGAIGALFYTHDLKSGGILLLQITLYLTQAICLFFILYQGTISYAGLRKYKPMTLKEPEKKFAVVVAAHNEELVVGDIIDNLHSLDYPKELYDIYVICDNCTDRTADIVRSKNGIAMERNEPDKRGKGYGLEWMFSKLWELEKQGQFYDAVVMFDADNLVNREFLSVMNTKLLEGHEVIQGYLDSKNPEDTWITRSYAFAYWFTNRIFQLSRQHLGLSAQIGGTGVVVSTRVLQEIGWGATSLTEDLEFTQRYLIQTGKPVAWAHEAKVFDEKPLEMKASWKQRVRWMQGHADCMMKYSYDLAVSVITKDRKMLYFDSLMYLLQPSRILLAILMSVFTILSWFNLSVGETFNAAGSLKYAISASILPAWVFIAINIFYYALPFIGVIAEKKAKSILWAPLVYIFGLTWLPITVIGIMRRKQKNWSHTKHTRSIKHTDIEF